MHLDADVIVIGAGPAGCAAAIRLVGAGYNVLALERKEREDGEDITSGEVLVVPTQNECAQLGVKFEGDWVLDRITGFRNVYPDLSWTYHPILNSVFPVQVDRGGFNAALRRRLVEAGGRLIWNARVTDLEFKGDAAIAITGDGNRHAARMLIDAGGRYAPSLRALNLKSEDPEFSQIGVAVFFEAFDGTPLHTWDRHLYGVRGAMISGSRIRPGLYRYILEADLAEKQTDRLGAIEFYESVARHHDRWLYERVMREPRVGRQWSMAPLGYRVSAVARDRILLVGDAAGYLSPITGQGNEFAMRTGRLAAIAAESALRVGDLSASAFAPYVEGRRYEVDRQVDYVRAQLRILRDPDALLRASRDDEYRTQVFGPYGIPASERGSLV
ncbi:MAG: FAD-dependent monooxygenase [Candidatus Binatus sp.]|jgi:flavin-dependent dehydrogenase|uniref:NAD(P)/FAD-dependent oxidoreductase n=1 Tax=Candidatus Binatus sp. TaxID=2811406 RepID=UPI003C7907F6